MTERTRCHRRESRNRPKDMTAKHIDTFAKTQDSRSKFKGGKRFSMANQAGAMSLKSCPIVTALLLGVFCFAFVETGFAFVKNGTVYTTDGSQADVAAAIADAKIGDTVG